MTTCSECGVDCFAATAQGSGETVMLETREEMSGEHRWLQVGNAPLGGGEMRPVVERLSESYPERGYVEHKFWCAAAVGYAGTP